MIGRWSRPDKKGNLSQVIDRVKPAAPLKSKIEAAQGNLEMQIRKLDAVHGSLRAKSDVLFNKVVDAQRANHNAYARAYATELGEVRKMCKLVSGSKLAMEQIKLRLNTVSELGDIVVTLSPCMSIIKGLGPSLAGMVPDAAMSMQDLSSMLGDVLQTSSVNHTGELISAGSSNSEALEIMEEAQAKISGQAKALIPDVPAELKDEIVEERQGTMI
jgi:division protein CdvB (Snf7/Vps24/ESCRT-III family)